MEGFPAAVIDEMGHQLFLVQIGSDPENWKPMSIIGPGVREIRVSDEAGIFRTIYLATRPEAVYVLHCFQKKTRRTDKRDIELAKKRLKDISR